MSVCLYLFKSPLYLVYVQNLKKLHLSTLQLFNPSTSTIFCAFRNIFNIMLYIISKIPDAELSNPRFCMRRFSPTTTPCPIKKSRPCVLAGGGLIVIPALRTVTSRPCIPLMGIPTVPERRRHSPQPRAARRAFPPAAPPAGSRRVRGR